MQYHIELYEKKKREDGSEHFETIGSEPIPKHFGRAYYSWCRKTCLSRNADGYRTYRVATPLNKPFYLDARVLEPTPL